MVNVTHIYLIPDGQGGGLSIQDQAGFTATRVYQVEFDGPNDSIWLALEARNTQDPIPADEVYAVPNYGLAHPDDPTSFVLGKHAEGNADAPWLWKVTVAYGYPRIDPNARGSPKPGEKPTPIPSIRTNRGTWSRQKAWEKDLLGNPVLNSAGEPFDPPLTTDNTLMEWTIVRTQSSFSDDWKSGFENSINDGKFTMGDLDCDDSTLRVARISAEEVPATDKTPRYFTVTIVIQYDPQGWQPEPYDRGWRKKGVFLGLNLLLPIYNPGGQKPAQPPFLNGAGQPLAFGANPIQMGPFKLYERVDFADLALDIHS